MDHKMLTDEQLEQFGREGYIILRGLLGPGEVASLRDHFMDLHGAGPVEGFFDPKPLEEAGDILLAYPRFMHPHRVDEMSRQMMLDTRFEGALADLFGEEPIAAQSMFYYKPPGARGQALHQDNFYLVVAPGSCMAAWVALDDIDPENGGLFVVPGSHKTTVQCPHRADPATSFSREEVDVPEGMAPVATEMQAGDVLFFNGSLIHGSSPNQSKDRFRRSFICHYLPASSSQISQWYFPLHRFDGTPINFGEGIEYVAEGNFCGTEELATLRNGFENEVTLA